MFLKLNRHHWNLATLTAFSKDEKTGEYLLMFPIGGGNVKVKKTHPAYHLVEAYLSSKTESFGSN